jgi:hypothetical protein
MASTIITTDQSMSDGFAILGAFIIILLLLKMIEK